MKTFLLLCFGVMVALPAWTQLSPCCDFSLIRKDTILTQPSIVVLEPPIGKRIRVTFEDIPAPVVITNVYDDQQTFVTYTGSWTKASNTTDPFHLRTCTYSNSVNASFTVTFTGELQMWSAKASHHGKIGVSLNEGPEIIADMYSPTRINDVMIFNSLVGGTIKVRVISGYCVVDYFKEIK